MKRACVAFGLCLLLAGVAPARAAETKAAAKPVCPKTGEAPDPAECRQCPHASECPCRVREAAAPAVAMPAGPTAEEKAAALAEARARAALEDEIPKLIRRLATPDWKNCEAELLRIGRPAVPFLIQALHVEGPGLPPSTYPLKAPGRASRTRPVTEVAYGLLVELLQNHSDYTGPLPGLDRKAWEAFWAEKGPAINFGQK